MKYVIWAVIFIFTIVLGALAWETIRANLFAKETQEIVENHNIVLEEIEKMGKIELVRYKFKDILEHQVKYKWVPNSKAILIISGEAVGCIDLQKVKLNNIKEGKDTITVHLPAPELCYAKINHKESKVYDTEYTYFKDAEIIDQAYKEAENAIQKIALQSNILEQTRINAQQILKPLLENITKKKVILIFELENKEIKKQ
ncbi:MAG: DUF4230 domain-containing protein [Cytophagales bacterium]|nr:MAG: DUF4230 domain-containing protein [Cytophagales bacterium]